MAPEYLDENPILSYAVDYWALGVIIYELITGCIPFNSNDEFVKLEQISDVEVDYDKLKLGKYYTEEIGTLIKLLLVKDPDIRTKNFSTIKNTSFLKNVDWDNLINTSSKLFCYCKQVINEQNLFIQNINKVPSISTSEPSKKDVNTTSSENHGDSTGVNNSSGSVISNDETTKMRKKLMRSTSLFVDKPENLCQLNKALIKNDINKVNIEIIDSHNDLGDPFLNLNS